MSQQHSLQSPIIPSQIVPLIHKASQNSVPVLILGEQGTGKEWAAKAIHQAGIWKSHGFHKIDCRMLKQGVLFALLNSLFREIGYGVVRATLFFKEVGYLSHGDQLKLLELMEEGLFRYDSEERMVKNIRWIASSSDHLREKIRQGQFSEDLFDRLNTLSISIPPLRDRRNDIPLIARYLLVDYATKMNLKKKGISQNVLSLLQGYWWPGNLKELETIILRSAIFSEGEDLMERDLFATIENERNSFSSFLKRGDSKNPYVPNGDSYVQGQQPFHWIFFLTELVHRIKNPMVSIKTFTQLLQEKFNDWEYREAFYKVVSEDVDKIDVILNGLTNYVKMNTPLSKMNTVHQILEEALRRYDTTLERKKIKVIKRFEKDLPETTIHDEPLRYIFYSLLQYALPAIPPGGTLGFLTRAQIPKEGKEHIDVMMIFSGLKKPILVMETAFGDSTSQQEDAFELELTLIHDVLKNHQGTITFEVQEKKARSIISLKLPMERRKMIYYPSANVHDDKITL
jgi:hypothetical protein